MPTLLSTRDSDQPTAAAAAPGDKIGEGASPSGSITTTTSPTSSASSSSTNTSSGTSNASSTGTTKTSSTKGPSSTTSHPQSKEISAPVVAGISIGTAIAGAGIAALILLLFFNRYKKRHQRVSRDLEHVPHDNSAIEQEKITVPTKGGGVVSVLEAHLPQPVEDGTITGEMSKLRDKIKNHVQNFYHLSPVDPKMVNQTQLQEISNLTGLHPSRLWQLLQAPDSRYATIRLYLSCLILSRCSGEGSSTTSFLPVEVGLFSLSTKSLIGASLSERSHISKCKSISAALLEDQYGSEQTRRKQNPPSIAQAMAAANSFLIPFASDNSEKRLRNLEGIMHQAAQFAFLLYSQPSVWSFNWYEDDSIAARVGIVVFPALLQLTNDEAQVIRPPRVFTSAERFSGFSSQSH